MDVSPAVNMSDLPQAIAEWLRGQMETAGADRLVLGLSGGIDSAVVCGLCAMAAGPAHVIGVIMPIHSHPHDLRDAEEAARRFGVPTRVVALSGAYDAMLAALDLETPAPATDDTPGADQLRARLAMANIKPRLRMTALYAIANSVNGLVVGTGNKTELAVGYFTKYGDGGVDLLPIAELDKTAVRALAREIAVPEAIIARAPSAGLWEGQTDEAELGVSYGELDLALKSLMADKGHRLPPALRERVEGLIGASAHKRAAIPVFLYRPVP